MTCLDEPAEVARHHARRLVGWLRSAVLPLILSMAVAGVMAAGAPAQARENYGPNASAIRKSFTDTYMSFSNFEIGYNGNPDLYEEFVAYAKYDIPAYRSYLNASILYSYICQDASGVAIDFRLLVGEPEASATGLDQIRTGTRVGGVASASSNSGMDNLPNVVLEAMNRLSSEGGGTLYLGVSGARGSRFGCRFNTFTLAGLVAPPAVSSLSPASGPTAGGNTVTLTGTHLGGASSVTFGGAPATNVSSTVTEITMIAPARAAGTVDVIVTTPGGTETLSNGYAYIPAPTVSAVSPNSGPATGGTTVSIGGSNLAGATSVTFGGAAGAILTATSDTLTVAVPAGSVGAATLLVTTPGGTAALPDGYTYIAAPTISSVTPSSGPLGGSNTVTIHGTALAGANGVSFDGLAATNLIAWSDRITATAPSHGAGPVTVLVSTRGGTASAANAYTFVAAPTITSITPSVGPTAGGDILTIVGTHLAGATSLTVGGAPATNINATANQITATAPPGAVGTANVVVTTPGGVVTASNAYSYAAPPTITSVSPAAGSTAGGAVVTIGGTRLSGATSLTFGGVAATNVNVSADQITATTPAHAAGAVDVVVLGPGGAATLAGGFTYMSSPTISAISPSGGLVGGGDTVTLTGTHLAGATRVTFGGAVATLLSASASQISVTAPARSTGAADVVVETPTGTATATNGYTYRAAPTVSITSPSEGGVINDRYVTVTGVAANAVAVTVVAGGQEIQGAVDGGTWSVSFTAPLDYATHTITVRSTNGFERSPPATVTVTIAPPPSADLSVSITGNTDPVASGSRLTYTITIANAGPDAATAVSLSSSLTAETTFLSLSAPGGWNCVTPTSGVTGALSCSGMTIANGQGAVFTLIVAVDAATASGSTLTNTVSISSATGDPDSNDATASAATSVIAPPPLIPTMTEWAMIGLAALMAALGCGLVERRRPSR